MSVSGWYSSCPFCNDIDKVEVPGRTSIWRKNIYLKRRWFGGRLLLIFIQIKFYFVHIDLFSTCMVLLVYSIFILEYMKILLKSIKFISVLFKFANMYMERKSSSSMHAQCLEDTRSIVYWNKTMCTVF